MIGMDRQTDMSWGKKILVVIPAYNEEDSILNVAKGVSANGYDCIVVNDGSSDSTARICSENSIPLLNLSVNLGIGGAVQTGLIYAYENGYDIAIQFDGDGQHDVSSLPNLIDAIQNGADLAIGSRFVAEVEGNFRSTGLRRLGIRWLSGVIHFITGKKIYDVTSGFRASGKRALELFRMDYPFDYPEPESIVTAVKHGLNVVEVTAKMNERQGGSSSIKALSSLYYMVKVSLAIVIQGVTRHGRIKER